MNLIKIVAGVAGVLGLLSIGFKAGEKSGERELADDIKTIIIEAQNKRIDELIKSNKKD